MMKQSHDKLLASINHRKYETREISIYRKSLLTNTLGDILEIGVGSGVNLSYYPKYVDKVTGVDTVIKELKSGAIHVEHYYSKYDVLPFEDNQFDTVVSFFTFSHIIEIEAVLIELKRILKPRGRLIFMDTGLSENTKEIVLQEVLNPLWEVFAKKNLNRNYYEILKEHNFLIAKEQRVKVMIKPLPLLSTLYCGIGVNIK